MRGIGMRIQGVNFGERAAFQHQMHNKIYKVSEHIHQYAELIIMLEGETRLTVDGRVEYLTAGDAALIFPFQKHSMSSKAVNKLAMYLFSSSVIPDVKALSEGKVGENASFTLSEATDKLHRDFILGAESLALHRVKAFLYMVLGYFFEKIKLTDRSRTDNVVSKVITYMYAHYTEPISLESVASALGYSSNYLSHCITKLYGLNFCSALACLRIERARALITSTDKSNSEICYECGFGSERSYIRQFKSIMGFTPSEYRKKYFTGPVEGPKTEYFD